MAQLSGKNVKIRYGASSATILRCVGGTVTPTVDNHDITNGESAGVAEPLPGVLEVMVDLEADYYYSASNGPYATLMPGTVVTGTKLYVDGTSNAYWDIPYLLVVSAPMEWRARGKITIRFRGQGYGTVVAPQS